MQRMRSAGTPAAPHRCCPPQHVPLRRRSVYGLVSGTILPGRLPTPKRSGIVTRLLLTYRCGGSAGLAFVGFTASRFTRVTVRSTSTERSISLPRIWRGVNGRVSERQNAGVRDVHNVYDLRPLVRATILS